MGVEIDEVVRLCHRVASLHPKGCLVCLVCTYLHSPALICQHIDVSMCCTNDILSVPTSPGTSVEEQLYPCDHEAPTTYPRTEKVKLRINKRNKDNRLECHRLLYYYSEEGSAGDVRPPQCLA
jgi:hydrogenase maturation factor